MAFFGNRRQNEQDSPEQDESTARQMTPQQPIGFETVLGASNVMNGTLVSKGNVRLDGEFTGDLDISGNVLVGETANIQADIEARNISIAGTVRGNVNGNKVQILRTGKIWGDIVARSLTMEEGAFVDGKIAMIEHSANQPELAEPAPEETAMESDVIEATEPEETADDTVIEAEDGSVTVEDSSDDETDD